MPAVTTLEMTVRAQVKVVRIITATRRVMAMHVVPVLPASLTPTNPPPRNREAHAIVADTSDYYARPSHKGHKPLCNPDALPQPLAILSATIRIRWTMPNKRWAESCGVTI